MAITSVKNANNVHLGLGTLGLATYPGTSPVTYSDVGYIKACSLEYSREFKDFTSAGLLVKRLVFRDTATLKTTWAEIKMSNLAKVFNPAFSYINEDGSGNSTGLIEFGGYRTITRYLVRFESVRDDGKTVTVDIWKSTPTSTATLAFAEEEYITYPAEFGAELDSARSSGRQYGRITIG